VDSSLGFEDPEVNHNVLIFGSELLTSALTSLLQSLKSSLVLLLANDPNLPQRYVTLFKTVKVDGEREGPHENVEANFINFQPILLIQPFQPFTYTSVMREILLILILRILALGFLK